jgi:acyl-CoA reductase-like NAD-dependent aldehyde dehydrogenase
MSTAIKNKKVGLNGTASPLDTNSASRLDIKKTYKLYIDGKFPRTESGRFYQLKNESGNVIGNICRGSRKDLRDAVVSNRKAQGDWSKRSAYNKAQILYRIAETLEGRKAQFVDTMMKEGYKEIAAKKEIEAAIDLLVYYAGWSDKYIQIFSSVNPVESSHFNFSYPEPTGIVNIFCPQNEALIGLISHLAPAIIGGNTCTLVVAEKHPMTAIDFAEVIHASDLPGGVVNIITGHRKEFIAHASSHMDVNAIVYSDLELEHQKTVQINASLNVKRVVDYSKEQLNSPYRILACQEIKTTWHPVGI